MPDQPMFEGAQTPQKPGSPKDFQLMTSRGFLEWLTDQRMSLALTTYQAGKLVMLGVRPDGNLAIQSSAFDRAIGLWTDGQTLWLATTMVLWRLENCLAAGQRFEVYERVFVPRVGLMTGDLDIHDVGRDDGDRPIFVNTRFGCLATADERFSFRALWRPPFLSELAPEDRCHLNGLALQAGRPKYVTLCARSDVADGWRDFKRDGGCLMDVETGAVVAAGLSMPHSPRFHEGKLWLLNSGTGYLGTVDIGAGRFEPVTFLPGYARGLAFHSGHAIVGLSQSRHEHTFQGLPLDENLRAKGAAARCGLAIVELGSGTIIHWVRLEGSIHELYDVVALPGIRAAKSLSIFNPSLGQRFCAQLDGCVRHWMTPIRPDSSAPARSPRSIRALAGAPVQT